MKIQLHFLFPFLALLLLLSGCATSSQSDPAAVVSGYLRALVDKDQNRLIGLSCAAWEEGARMEYDSLAALEVSMETPVCQVTGQQGETTLVSCAGKMVFNYGAEVLEVDLGDKVYVVVSEGGEQRVCGYQ